MLIHLHPLGGRGGGVGLVPLGGPLGGSGGGDPSVCCVSATTPERGGIGGTGFEPGLLGGLRGGYSTGTFTGASLSYAP